MRKMKMPEMDVVRFNESDVIVASGEVPAGVLRVSGLVDSTSKNGTFAFLTTEGTTTSYKTNEIDAGFYSQLDSAFNTGGQVSSNTLLGVPGQNASAFRWCIDFDGRGQPLEFVPDGNYEWNERMHCFYLQ